MSKLPTFLSWSSQIKIYPQPPANVTKAVIKTEELCSGGVRGRSDELSQRELGRKPTGGVTEESSKGVGIFRKTGEK